jgi:hypothetical protein
MEQEKLSIANLMRQSAMQLCYLRKKKQQKQPTQKQYAGVEHQKKVSISEFVEMRGCYSTSKYLLFFSFDEVFVHDDTVIFKEHKNIKGPIENWYLEYCLLQTAVYQQLAMMQEEKMLYTAKFFQKQGYNCNVINYENKKLRSILSLGEQNFYNVYPNSTELVNYFLRKADASQEYETAKQWDALYKFKDWHQLNKYLTFQKH